MEPLAVYIHCASAPGRDTQGSTGNLITPHARERNAIWRYGAATMTIAFDTLKLADRLEAAGMSPQQAKGVATALAETATANLVTREFLDHGRAAVGSGAIPATAHGISF